MTCWIPKTKQKKPPIKSNYTDHFMAKNNRFNENRERGEQQLKIIKAKLKIYSKFIFMFVLIELD